MTKSLGNLEKQIMNIVWSEKTPVSVRFVTDSLRKKRQIAYTTVMTIMSRLVKKEILSRRLHGLSYLYKPKFNREKYVAKTVHSIFTSAVSAFGGSAVSYFVREIQKLSPKKRRELLQTLDKK